MAKGTLLLVENPHLVEKKAVFLAARNSSILAIFLQLFGGTVAQAVAGDDPAHQTDFFRYLSLRMLLHGLPTSAKACQNMERDAYFSVLKSLEGKVPPARLWGCRKYFTVRNDFPVLEQHVRGPIAEKWASLLRAGESIAFDEKQLKWRGKSMYIHMNRAKPDPIGHMVCMLTTTLEASPIPFTVGMYAYMTNKDLGLHLSADTLMKWATGLIGRMQYIERRPIIVNDCLYTTIASRETFVGERQRFISAQKPSWWTAMEAMLQPKVNQPGDTAYALNEKQGLVVCCHFDAAFRGGARKYVVSNAFTHHSAPEYNRLNPPVYSEYAATFNACDQFNMRLSKNWYPYRAGSYGKHFEMMFLSIAFMNFYSICIHTQAVAETMSFKEFLVMAGTLLAEKYF